MADGTLGGLGSSIGLTATPKDYSSLYRYSQQLRAQQEKAKQDKLDDIFKNVTIKVGEQNLHDLEVGPMHIRVSQFIDRARQHVGQDDMSGFYQELASFQADLNNAKNRSKGYWDLEKTVKDAAAGNKYVPKNVRQAANLMLNSASSADYINALNENEIKRNAFFDYDEQGHVMTQSFDTYDINKAVKDLVAGNSVIIGRGPETFDPITKTKIQPYVKGLPLDDAAAGEVRKMVGPDGVAVEPTLTAKQIPSILLQNPALAAQYIDTYDLEDKTPDEVEQHFFETVVKPNVKLKESVQTTKQPGSTNVYVSTGTAADYAFEGSPIPELNFGASVGGKSMSFATDSKYSVPLAVGDLKFRFTPTKTLVFKNTSLPYKGPTTTTIDANYVNILPYEIKDGIKIVTSNERVKQLKSQGQKVKYAAFVEGKTGFIGAEGEVTNPDFYTEFTPALRANFANQAATKGKQAGAAFAKGMVRLDKELAAANR